MWIVNLKSNANGSHNHRSANHITSVPDGWAMIPDDFAVPDTFPFVDIEAEELSYEREVEVMREVTKTREVETIDAEGKPITVPQEYTEMERVTERHPYEMMTVTKMTPGVVPEPVERVPEPTAADDTAAMLVDHEFRLTLLELGVI